MKEIKIEREDSIHILGSDFKVTVYGSGYVSLLMVDEDGDEEAYEEAYHPLNWIINQRQAKKERDL